MVCPEIERYNEVDVDLYFLARDLSVSTRVLTGKGVNSTGLHAVQCRKRVGKHRGCEGELRTAAPLSKGDIRRRVSTSGNVRSSGCVRVLRKRAVYFDHDLRNAGGTAGAWNK